MVNFQDELVAFARAFASRSDDELRQGLLELVPGDDLLWTRIDLQGASALAFRATSRQSDTALSGDLARTAACHPSVASYLVSPSLRPRRLSDVCSDRQWRSSPAWTDCFARTGERFQLSMVVDLAGGVGEGWVVTRSAADFSDDDVDRAGRLQPLLVAMRARLDPRARRVSNDRPGHDLAALTPRELEVVRLLATGLTADAIAHQLHIGTPTVRKHVEHIYAKFGCHDRLLVAQYARELGLLNG